MVEKKYIDPLSLFEGSYKNFWLIVEKRLGEINPTSKFFKLNYMYKTTQLKLFSARYHFTNMMSIYKREDSGTKENQDKLRAEVDSFFFSLKSSLDLLGQEIKIVYDLDDLKEEKLNINIVKDKMKKLNEPLGFFIYDEMEKEWFKNFKLYRDVVSHRNLPIMCYHIKIGINEEEIIPIILKKHKDLTEYLSESEIIKEFKILYGLTRKKFNIMEVYFRDDPTDLSPKGNLLEKYLQIVYLIF